MARIDLNCDLGEGAGQDAALMPLITSANIACGGHAGDAVTMRATVELALARGVAIGAHPGFADRANFGRVEFPVTSAEVYALVLTQTRALQQIAREVGATVTHVKPHGALYNQVARDAALAAAVAEAVHAADATLRLFALAGSELVKAGRARGLRVASEVFADRTYRADGSLTPRSAPNALIEEAAAALVQVKRMVREGFVTATNGAEVRIEADTVCVHGDGAHAVEFARRLGVELRADGVVLEAFCR